MTDAPLRLPYGDLQRKVIGYARVSTEDQTADVEKQVARIREGCHQQGLTPVAIYEDVGSGLVPDMMSRSGLRDAVREAKRRAIPLVVTDRTRISRIVGEAERLSRETGVPIICIEDGFVPLPTTPAPEGALGQRFAEKVADGTRKALAKRKASNVRLGNPNLTAARRRAAISNRIAFDDRIREIVRLLRSEDPYGKLSARDIVDLLNSRGIRSGRGRLWTLDGIRRPLRAARKQIELEDEVSMELDVNGLS